MKQRNPRKRKLKLMEKDAAWLEKNQVKMDKYIGQQQKIYDAFRPNALSLAVSAYVKDLQTK